MLHDNCGADNSDAAHSDDRADVHADAHPVDYTDWSAAPTRGFDMTFFWSFGGGLLTLPRQAGDLPARTARRKQGADDFFEPPARIPLPSSASISSASVSST
ncbi:hypothetical protein [Bifidobacterium anseris]|uniref:hypothetical protein n=1 Tax=Bifidobacterium anseris TaxID=2020963 RepID=UPI00105464D6|nr:hypothetical protein [Bifidobacterium anseris]